MITVEEIIARQGGQPPADAPKQEEQKQEGQKPEAAAEPNKEAPPQKEEEKPAGGTNAPDVFSLLNERTGGKIAKEEDLNSLLETREKYTVAEKELADYRSKVEQYEAQPKQQYANPLTETLDGMYKNGATQQQIETFLSLQGKDLTAMDGLEAKTLRLMHEKGFTREQATEEIHDAYNLDEGKYDADEIEKAKRRIERNKPEDVKYLEGLKKDVSSIAKGPDPEAIKEAEAKKAVYESQVSGFAKEVATKITGLGSVELVAEKDEEPIKLELNFSEDFKAQAPELAKQYMLQNKLSPSKEAEAQVKDYLNRVYFAANGEEILKTVSRHVRSVTLEREHARVSNRAPRNNDEQKPNIGGELTLADALRAGFKNAPQGRRFLD